MIDFIVFLTSVIFAFFIPGIVFVNHLKRSFGENIILSIGLGIVLWAIQGYVFGMLHIRWMTYVYILFFSIVFLIIFRKFFSKKNIFLFKFKLDFLSLLIILFGTILNLSAVWFIGVVNSDGMFFCCRGVPDAIYHLSLTNQLIKEFPPIEPGMSDVLVKNYHYLSNLVVADIARVFNLDFIKVQFQYMSLLLALLLGGSAFVFSNILRLGKSFARWLAIFLYGSGDILYILLFLRGQGLNFNVTIIDDASKLLAGPPRAFSVTLYLIGLLFFLIWIKKKNLYSGLLMAIVFGSLIGFKVYTGIFALCGLGALGFYYLIKKEIKMILPLVFSLVLSLIYYFQNNSNAGFLFFNGLWRFENFILHKDLSISKLEYLRLEALQNSNFLIVILLELIFIIIYFVFLFGITNLGFLQTKKSLKLFSKELNILLISSIFVCTITGALFYQSTGGANTVQFLITVFIFSSIYAVLSIYYWSMKFNFKLKPFIMVIIFLLITSRSLYEIHGNIVNIFSKKGFQLTNTQLESFSYLRQHSDSNSIIVVEPWMAEDEPFMYITFLTNRALFLSGAGILRDHGQNTKDREKIVYEIFNNNDKYKVRKLLNDNNIMYIYDSVGIKINQNINADFLEKVYEVGNYKIYKVI